MNTMKTFFKFAIVFVIMYVLFDLLTFAYIKTTYSKIDDYTISISAPEVKITDSKATKVNGYIKGSITNNTGKDIEVIYLKADFTSKENNYLGYDSMEIKNLKANETRDFEFEYRFTNVGSFELTQTDELEEKQKTIDVKFESNTTKYLLLTTLLITLVKFY